MDLRGFAGKCGQTGALLTPLFDHLPCSNTANRLNLTGLNGSGRSWDHCEQELVGARSGIFYKCCIILVKHEDSDLRIVEVNEGGLYQLLMFPLQPSGCLFDA